MEDILDIFYSALMKGPDIEPRNDLEHCFCWLACFLTVRDASEVIQSVSPGLLLSVTILFVTIFQVTILLIAFSTVHAFVVTYLAYVALCV